MSLVPNRAIEGAAGNQGYNIQRSLRFRSSASAYLNRTLGTPTSELVWTISVWVKRGILSNDVKPIICATDGSGAPQESIWYRSGDYIQYYCDSDGTDKGNFSTNAVYRDPSAWYHYVLSRNGTTITLYVNNVSQSVTTTTAIASYGVMNTSGRIQYLGFTGPSSYWNSYFDGYVTEFNFIDGQALTPSSFGETSTETGVWQPKKYTGTYGNNGCYLNFSDNTSATTLAYDKSGNGNNWTANNISTTAGATYDSMTDVPTLTSATAANFATLNPLVYQAASALTYSNANLTAAHGSGTTSAGGQCAVASTMSMTSGKWYFEFTLDSFYSNGGATPDITFGVQTVLSATNGPGLTTGWGIYGDGTKYPGGTAYGNSFTTNDIIGVAVDLTNSKIWFSKNGTWQASGDPAAGTNAAFTNVTGEVWAAFGNSTNSTAYNYKATANFGQRPFSYTPPTGFKALNTFNLPDPTIKKPNQYMDATLWTGNGGASQVITNAGSFQPDLVWVKDRSVARNNDLLDSVRGPTNGLFSNLTNAEVSSGYLSSFNSNGFTVGNDISTNGNGETFVGWQWKESATAGFDIVTYTGNGSSQNISHNLGVAPAMIIVKCRSAGGTGWPVYVASQGAGGSLYLHVTSAWGADTTAWNNTAPTSSVFTVGSNGNCNTNGATYVAYLFSEIPGFSKFGSYTGNGSTDGTFVYCGFRPKYVMVKASSNTSEWCIYDSSRDAYNVMGQTLYADASSAESSIPPRIDFLSNGFKLRSASEPNWSGYTVIYAAFAENPFKYSLGR